MTTDQEIKPRCPHCQDTGFVSRPEASPGKALTDEDLTVVAPFFAVVAFFGTLGFGGNFFLAVFVALVAFPLSAAIARAVDRRLGLR